MTPLVRLTPSAISRANRCAWPTTRLVEASSLAVASPKPLLALRSLGARRSGNVEHAQFDAPAAVAEFGAHVADDRRDLLHCPRENPHAVAKQARIG